MNGRHDGKELARLIERSSELKRDLVAFACSPRLERALAAAVAEAGLDESAEADAIGTIDRFALQYRLPDGKTVVDRFVASRPDLDAADREMLLGWRDPVESIFEIRSRDGDAIILLNLIDDLEYRTYSNMGPAAFRELPRDGFVLARLVPIRPVPGLPPGDAEERLNAYYRHRQEAALVRKPAQPRPPNLPGVDVPAFVLPPDLADADTIGIIYDDVDGLNFYPEYGMPWWRT